jgi:uncharacterized protein (TIGR02145 family)
LGGEYVAGLKMKSTSGWNSWDEDLTCTNCKSWNDEYKRKTACHVCKDTRINGKKTHSGKGTNSSGFSGLPGGMRFQGGYFSSIGEHGLWWSSKEYKSRYAYYCDFYHKFDFLSIREHGKEIGLSVRCLGD